MAMSLDLGELNKRLGREKAKSGDITASLIWNDPSDLDLHAEVTMGKKTEHIYYGNKKAAGGHLDVDMNVDTSGKRFSLHPVENIFWKSPPGGQYHIFVQNAGTHTDTKRWPEFKSDKRKIPFKVYLTKDKKTTSFAGACDPKKRKVSCFKFTVAGGSGGGGTGGGGSYIVFPASSTNKTFKDLCAQYKVTWQVGCGFYAVVRSEKIHAGKEMLLQHLSTNKFTVGRDKCLKALGWADSELKKGPKDLPAETMLFVQSTSYNRVIPAGTPVLFEVTPAEHAKHQKINAAALKEAQKAAKAALTGGAKGASSKAAPKTTAAPKAKAGAAKAGAKAGAKRAASPAAAKAAPAAKRAAGDGGGSVSGKSLVFTGTLTTPRAAATAAAKAAGASVQGAVSKNTDILVAGPGAGSKMAKAAALGVAVWDEPKFKRAVGL